MKLIWFNFLLLFTTLTQSQTVPDFINPLTPPLLLSGTFAELRSNHFHSGIDIKTGEEIGKPVIAVANGYVSRLKISPYGFGRVLYVTHTNGYTSVYAHLSRYNKKINDWITNEQYRQHKNTIELFPEKNKFPIKQGDTIAFSGNTGSSGGPHLHFEMRKTRTEHPVNPIKLGFDVEDTINPVIYKISITEMRDYIHTQKVYNCISTGNDSKDNTTYTISPETIKIDKPIGIAVKTYDYLNNSTNLCGINTIELFIDDKKYFEFSLDEYSYSQKRYINSLVDIPYYYRTKERFQRLYLQPNNQLPIYSTKINQGIISFNDTLTHSVKIIVSDSKDNHSIVSFSLVGPTNSKIDKPSQKGQLFLCKQPNKITNDTFSLTLSNNALYDDMYFNYNIKNDTTKYLSPQITIGDPEIPLHKKATLTIKPYPVKSGLLSKLTIVRINGKHISETGGYYKNGVITGKTYRFGTYTVMVDTTAPWIKPLDIYENAKFVNDPTITFQISDNLSGIQTYNCFIDGNWVLLSYDYRINQLTYYFDKHIAKSEKPHQLKLTVIDGKGNTGYYSTKFYY